MPPVAVRRRPVLSIGILDLPVDVLLLVAKELARIDWLSLFALRGTSNKFAALLVTVLHTLSPPSWDTPAIWPRAVSALPGRHRYGYLEALGPPERSLRAAFLEDSDDSTYGRSTTLEPGVRFQRVQAAVASGAHLEAPLTGRLYRALALACTTGDVPVVRYLLRAGADPNGGAGTTQSSPLHACVDAEVRSRQCTRLLRVIKAGGCLMFDVGKHYPRLDDVAECTRLLLCAGADAHQPEIDMNQRLSMDGWDTRLSMDPTGGLYHYTPIPDNGHPPVHQPLERSPLEVAWHEVVRDSRQRTAPRVAAVLKAPASKYRMWPRQPVASLTHIV